MAVKDRLVFTHRISMMSSPNFHLLASQLSSLKRDKIIKTSKIIVVRPTCSRRQACRLREKWFSQEIKHRPSNHRPTVSPWIPTRSFQIGFSKNRTKPMSRLTCCNLGGKSWSMGAPVQIIHHHGPAKHPKTRFLPKAWIRQKAKWFITNDRRQQYCHQQRHK